MTARPKSTAAWLMLLAVRLYIALLSPFFGGACKFHPSCSNYAHEAIALHGARRGFVLAMKRLLRCRPFTKGGFDPVPENLEESSRNLADLLHARVNAASHNHVAVLASGASNERRSQ